MGIIKKYHFSLSIFIFCFWILSFNHGASQELIPIEFDEALTKRFNLIEFPVNCKDSASLLLELDTLNQSFQSIGHLAARLIDIQKTDDKYLVQYDPGEMYSWMSINPGNVSDELLESLGFIPGFWKEKPVHFQQVTKLLRDLVAHYSNNGYPFASVKLDSIEIIENEVKGTIQLTKNKVFRFDSINIISTLAINPKFLERHLGLKKGELYDQSRIDEIPGKIRSLSFVRLDKQPTIQFKGNKVIVHLNLLPYQNSRFDILIGILPNDESQNRVRITGEITADLLNKLGQGEYAGFRYKSIAQGVQELSLELNYPYLLNLPFGVNSSFKLYSNNSLNRDIDFKLGVQYQLNSDQEFRIYWNNNSSRLLAVDKTKILSQRKLPANLDVRLNGIGMSFAYQNLNYRFNPRSGIHLQLNGTGGLKEVLPNEEIRSLENELVDFTNSYDTLSNGYQFSLNGLLEYYIPIARVFTLKGANQSGIKFSRQALYRNEAFRIGGSKLLRGFDEESLYTNRYSIFTLEARLLISTNSYFFVFGDYGLVSVLLDETNIFDQPYGIGTGLSLDTGAGILLISAAVGSQMGFPLDFGSSKVHVGYVNLF